MCLLCKALVHSWALSSTVKNMDFAKHIAKEHLKLFQYYFETTLQNGYSSTSFVSRSLISDSELTDTHTAPSWPYLLSLTCTAVSRSH